MKFRIFPLYEEDTSNDNEPGKKPEENPENDPGPSPTPQESPEDDGDRAPGGFDVRIVPGETPPADLPPGAKVFSMGPGDMTIAFAVMVFMLFCGSLPVPFIAILPVMIGAPLYAAYRIKLARRKIPSAVGCLSVLALPLSLLAVLFINGNLAGSINIIFAYLFYYGIYTGALGNPEKAKTSAIIRATFALIVYIAAEIVLLGVSAGATDPAGFEELLDRFFGMMRETYLGTFRESFDNLGSLFGSMPMPTDAELNELVDATLYSVRMMLPAILIVPSIVISFLSVSLVKPFLKLVKAGDEVKDLRFVTTMSSTAAVIYLILSFVSIFLSDGTVFYAFCNVTTILMPGFWLYGLKNLRSFFAERGMSEGAQAALIAVIAVVSLLMGDTGLMIVAMFGVWGALRVGFYEKMRPNKR